MIELLIYFVIAIAIAITLIILSPRYTIVPAHQAHVVVTRKGRRVYCSRKGYGSTYWFFPVLNKRSVLPLENVKMEMKNIPLRDKDMAKFLADVRCWICIKDPDLAAEKLGEVDPKARGDQGFVTIEADVQDLVQAVTRNSSMQMDVF